MNRSASTTLLIGLLAAAGCGPGGAQQPGAEAAAAPAPGADLGARADAVIRTWPEESAEVAREAIGMYGTPHEVAEGRLVWHDVGPWKRVIAYREVVQHDFPMPHIDVLEGFIDYRVPPERMDDLARFTGSLYVDRTKGEISARCDKEGANFLSINLAHEIITGRRTVEEARRFYGEAIEAKMAGNPPSEVQGFTFEAARGGTADPDGPILEM